MIFCDFDSHFEDSSDYSTTGLKELLDICIFDQYITSATHIKGQILDLLTPSTSDNLIN